MIVFMATTVPAVFGNPVKLPASYKRNTAPLKNRKWHISELDSLSIIKLGWTRCASFDYHSILGSVCQHSNINDDQIRARMQLLRLSPRAKYSSSSDYFWCLQRGWLGVYNTVSINGVWMRLINLSYGQDRYGALM